VLLVTGFSIHVFLGLSNHGLLSAPSCALLTHIAPSLQRSAYFNGKRNGLNCCALYQVLLRCRRYASSFLTGLQYICIINTLSALLAFVERKCCRHFRLPLGQYCLRSAVIDQGFRRYLPVKVLWRCGSHTRTGERSSMDCSLTEI
jgi:hypothetical protein